MALTRAIVACVLCIVDCGCHCIVLLLLYFRGLLMTEHEQSLEEMTAMSKEEMTLLLAVRNGTLVSQAAALERFAMQA